MFQMLLICCLVLCGCSSMQATGPTDAAPLRVMSYNIRNGRAKDGPNHWDKRKQLCLEPIRAFGPDLLGLQEAFEFQNRFIAAALPDHARVGVGRNNGKLAGEFATVFYRRKRFELIDHGTFWLSKTPQVPGSKSWDSSLPRIATWARLKDRADGGRELLFLNTHFDHRGKTARHESARQIRAFLTRHAQGAAVVVTGDFNAAPNSAPHKAMVGSTENRIRLVDTYAALHVPRPREQEGTAHRFNGKPSSGRIDWVLCSPDFKVRSASIDRFHREGRYPSDHFPVTAVLERGK